MKKRPIQRGRPTGATTYEAEPAKAFGEAVRALRTERGVAQETLAHLADVERSHLGKVERGEHMPTLVSDPQDRTGTGMQLGRVDGGHRTAPGRYRTLTKNAPSQKTGHSG